MPSPSDRNLLFGLLALHLDLVSREQLLAAVQAWMGRKGDPLALVLQERGALGEAERQAVDRLVEVQIARHGGDTQKSLAASRPGPEVRDGLWQLGDDDVQESLALIATVDDLTPTSPPLPLPDPREASASSRYRKLRPHARGGLGEVHVALDLELNREVALKEIRPQHADRPDLRQRFLREAQLTGALEHPGIVPIHGLGADPHGRPCYAMRFVKGRSLHDAIQLFHQADEAPDRPPGERELALRRLLTRFVAVCNAVAYAHSRHVVHRDLKPANVMLGDFGETYVIDWGLAKVLDRPEEATADPRPLPAAAEASATAVGQAVGTPAFMPPEQARGEHDRLDHRSDVFALGATLYCLLTGRPPYAGTAVLDQAAEGAPPPARQVNRRVPAPLDAVCRKAMAPRPEDRYPSAALLAADVERWLADEPVTAGHEPLAQKARRWARRHRTLVTSAAVLLVAAVVGLALGLGAVQAEEANTRRALLDARDHLDRALKAEQQATAHLAQSEANFQLARQAVDDCFGVAKDHPDLQLPNMLKARRLLLEKSLGFYQRFRAQRPDDRSISRDTYLNHLRIASIQIDLSRPDRGLEELLKAERLARQLAQSSPTPQHQSDLVNVLGELGVARSYTGRVSEAVKCTAEAVALGERLVADHPDRPDFLRQLAMARLNLGIFRQTRGPSKESRDHIARGVADLRLLVRRWPGSEEYQARLAQALAQLAGAKSRTGLTDQALEHATEAATLLRDRLTERPDSFRYQGELREVLTQSGIYHRALNQPRQAARDFSEAIDLGRRRVRAQPDVPGEARLLAEALRHRGLLHLRLNRPTDALADVDEACRLVDDLRKKAGDDLRVIVALADGRSARARVLAALGRHREAVADWDTAASYAPTHVPLEIRLDRARSLALAGDHGRVAAEADDLAGLDLDAGDRCALAGALALSAAAARRDPRLPLPVRERHADSRSRGAVALLAQAARTGFFRDPSKLALLDAHADLSFLRDRPDYRRFRASLSPPDAPQ